MASLGYEVLLVDRVYQV